MPVTLRKRPAPAEPPAPAPPAKKKSTVAKSVAKVKETVKKAAEPKATKAAKAAPASKTNGSKAKAETKVEAPVPLPQVKASKASAAAPAPAAAATTKAVVGETIDLKGFGGEIETNEGEKTTLEKLVSESKNGVVLFTYPKASTPGCKYPTPSKFIHLSIHLNPISHLFNLIFIQSLISSRHKPSLRFPRFSSYPPLNRLHHLWSLKRFPQIQHHL